MYLHPEGGGGGTAGSNAPGAFLVSKSNTLILQIEALTVKK